MTFIPSIPESQVFTGLRAWIMDALGLDGGHVIRELGNRVPMPSGPFVLLRTNSDHNLSTPVIEGDFLASETVTQPKEHAIQLDLYGPASGDWASILSTMFRTSHAVLFLVDYDVAPLWAEDPKHLPTVDGEQQYESRWVLNLHLQYNPVITVPQDFIDSGTVAVIDTTRVYHP